MKQFNSTSGKTVILPLYSTVELEDRLSSTKETNSDEINLLTDSPYCSLIHKKCTSTDSLRISKNGCEKKINRRDPQTYIHDNQSTYIKSFPPTTKTKGITELQNNKH